MPYETKGCLFPVGILCHTKENVMGLSSSNAKTPWQNNHNDGNRHESLQINNKHYIFTLKKDNNKKSWKTSKERRKEKKRQSQAVSHYMFGVSIQTLPEEMIHDNHQQITKLRVEKIPALQWCHLNVVLTN
jgi:hypothetical protein